MSSPASRLAAPPSQAGADRAPRPLARAVLAGTVALLVGLGGVLWALRGEAVFSDTVLAALALCF